ncbi:Catsper1 [Symbiodinium natans]|uniref:Catsper1 protein n=1 Tax=Symbiodinium natans TaxID=878477 RepID=A0A812QH89_9DINO|nr:Catsper1 [Symbiodinium natans]
MCRLCSRRSTEPPDDESDGDERMEKTLHKARSNLSNSEDKHVDEKEWKEALATAGLESKSEEKVYWVEHHAFESFFAVIILLNVIAIGLEIDMKESTPDVVWVVVGNVFCVTWIVEAFVKIWEMRRRYFKDCLNYIDMILVVLTVADVWILPYVTDVESNLVVFRMLRLMRLLRLVKLVQVLRRFRNLWLLVQGFAESVTTLNWVFLMLCLIMYTFAVCLRLAVDCKGVFADWSDCEAFFGTIPRTMYTLVQVVTLESWNMTVGRPLVDRQPLLFPVLLLYIFLTTFGLLNIIVGVIVENTLNIASSDQDLQDRRMQRQLLQELEFLKQVFESADADGSGTLEREEFVEICQQKEVKNALLRMEVPAEQPEELFDILDEEGVGHINFVKFHESVKKVRGVPTNFDMKNMMVSVSDILRRQARLQAQHDRTKQIVLAIFNNSIGAEHQLLTKSSSFDNLEVHGFSVPKRAVLVEEDGAKSKQGHCTENKATTLRHSYSLQTESLEVDEGFAPPDSGMESSDQELENDFRRSSTNTLEDITWKDPAQPEAPAGHPPY